MSGTRSIVDWVHQSYDSSNANFIPQRLCPTRYVAAVVLPLTASCECFTKGLILLMKLAPACVKAAGESLGLSRKNSWDNICSRQVLVAEAKAIGCLAKMAIIAAPHVLWNPKRLTIVYDQTVGRPKSRLVTRTSDFIKAHPIASSLALAAVVVGIGSVAAYALEGTVPVQIESVVPLIDSPVSVDPVTVRSWTDKVLLAACSFGLTTILFRKPLLSNARRHILPRFPTKFASFSLRQLQTAIQHNDAKSVNQALAGLERAMEKKKDDARFIVRCLTNLNELLENTIFRGDEHAFVSETSSHPFQELQGLFGLIDRYLPICKDTALAEDLRIKLANLPCKDRAVHTNLLLSKTNQLEILIKEFQRLENEAIKNVVSMVGSRNLTAMEGRILSRLAHSTSSLSDDSRRILRTALGEHIRIQITDWDDRTEIRRKFPSNSLSPNSTWLETLKRSVLAKRFFVDQRKVEDHLKILHRWCHTTQEQWARQIIKDGKQEVRKDGLYAGCWISSRDEISPRYGSWVLARSEAVEDTHLYKHLHIRKGCEEPADVTIRAEQSDRRWRGVQYDLPACIQKDNKTIPLLTMVAVPPQADKQRTKQVKAEVAKELKDRGLTHTRVFTTTQFTFMQNQANRAIGQPNLSPQWWSRETQKWKQM